MTGDIDFELDIQPGHFGPQGLQLIARAMAEREVPLRKIIIPPSTVDPFLADFAAEFDKNPNSLPNELCLWGCHDMDIAGCKAFGEVLLKRCSPLEKLEIPGIDESTGYSDGVAALLQVLRTNPSKSPKKLLFCHFVNTHMKHIEAILRNKHCSLETMCVDELYPEHFDMDNLLCSICCDPTSIDTTYNSNHTFSGGYFPNEDSPIVNRYCEMNKNPDKMKVDRMKVYEAHFARNFNLEFFKDMEPSLLAQVLQFSDRTRVDVSEFTSRAIATGNAMEEVVEDRVDVGEVDDGKVVFNNLSTTYMMVKNIPSLFDTLLNRR